MGVWLGERVLFWVPLKPRVRPELGDRCFPEPCTGVAHKKTPAPRTLQ